MRLINLVFKSLILVNFLELAIASTPLGAGCGERLARLQVVTVMAADPLHPIRGIELIKYPGSGDINAVASLRKGGTEGLRFGHHRISGWDSHHSETLFDLAHRMLIIEYFDRAKVLHDPGVIVTLEGAAFLTESDHTLRLQKAMDWGRIPRLVDSAEKYREQIRIGETHFFDGAPPNPESAWNLGRPLGSKHVLLEGESFWVSEFVESPDQLFVSKSDPFEWHKLDPFRSNRNAFPIAPSKRERWKFE